MEELAQTCARDFNEFYEYQQTQFLTQLARQHNIKLTIVLDIIHVIEYLWKAAFVFHITPPPISMVV